MMSMRTTVYLILLVLICTVYFADVVYAGAPDETLKEYINAMKNYNSSPYLDFYTQQTREMLNGWNVSPTQMDNIVMTYGICYSGETIYNDSYSLAVIRYSIKQKQCSPWFFKYINGKWLLDLTMMQRAIRFGTGNAWHFVAGLKHEYDFGFTDWRIDKNGYPVSTGY